MSTHPDLPPVSPDRPVVDGRDRSPEELREEVGRHSDSDLEQAQKNVQELRGEFGASMAELAARLDVPTRARARGMQVRDDVLAAARAHTALIAGAITVIVFALVARRLRRSPQS